MGSTQGPFRGGSAAGDEPFSHGILDKDEGSRRALKMYLKPVIMATIMIWIVIWTVLSIYWGK
jgi:hypothetical protein